ncbi:LysR family transcriptional regulator [Streptomyces sp. ODS28]|uniref:LysR family transcriptional regulator n=1 Tax=Streptomyces sp. ODS28 TaxID=3136688 RepID=UPI0031E8DB88
MPTDYGRHSAPSTHQLHLFLTLATELHFRRSARRVFLSQGAFSQQISALERRLGLSLVDRTTRRVALTGAGSALVPYARAVLSAVDDLQRAVREVRRGSPGPMTLGSFEATASLPPVPAILDALRSRTPGLGIQLTCQGFAECPYALVNGLVDAAFTFLPVPEGVQTRTVATGPRCAAISSADPLAGRGTLTLADLAARPVIGWAPGVPGAWREQWSADPRPDGSRARCSGHEVAGYESALPLIALGEGIQFVPSVARELYPRPGVSYVEVTDLPPCTAVLAWLPERRDDPRVAALRHAADAVLARADMALLAEHS